MRRLLSDRRPRAAPALRVAAAAGHAVVLAGMAVFTVVVVALVLPAFRHDAVAPAARVVVAAVAVLSVIRPGGGLIALAAGVALAEFAGPFLGSHVRNAELLVLAALAGALLRGWWSGAIRRFPQGRLETAALVFGLVIVASYLEQLRLLQIQRDFPGPFLAAFWAYVRTDYLVGPSIYGGTIFSAMLLLEGLALLVWAQRLCRADPRFAGRLMDAAAVGGIATAAVTVLFVMKEFTEWGQPAILLPWFMWTTRWAVHVQDVNAAASYFALALFLAGGRALVAERGRRLWMAGTVLVGMALLMTHSRTVMVAVCLVAAAAIIWVIVKTGSWRQAVPAAAMTGVLLAGFLLSEGVVRRDSGVAMDIRLEFIGTTARMLAWQPMSGVGVGQFNLWSQHFSSPELLSIYRVENAHNNFAQIAGELGLPGLAALVVVVALALARWRRSVPAARHARIDRLALVAFVATWLGNHPLLLPAVAFPFWIALGGAPAPDAGARETDTGARALAGDPPGVRAALLALALLLAISVPLRVAAKSETIDWTRISYGFHAWEGSGDARTRWMGRRARFYLPPEVARFRLPVRALVDETSPIGLDLLVEGRLATRVNMSSWDVHTLEVVLPGEPARGAWQIDLVASRSWVPADVAPESEDTRELSVMLWPLVLFDQRNALIAEEPESPAVQPPPRRPRSSRRPAAPREQEGRRESTDRPTRSPG